MIVILWLAVFFSLYIYKNIPESQCRHKIEPFSHKYIRICQSNFNWTRRTILKPNVFCLFHWHKIDCIIHIITTEIPVANFLRRPSSICLRQNEQFVYVLFCVFFFLLVVGISLLLPLWTFLAGCSAIWTEMI